ncbi:xanthine dehydrogenase family protein subunit M [Bradyrhizobium sp. NP1]|uniref:FAD binding domain-containing protein n=1 Tax=Bradyrhizobium sp. NP1 TaxID=3049772 RepID=UPI0025A5CC9D|nr:xanthine dehydrogenase family protein subunit M [Bradyrhizobium sp. NP1]WJR80897.1 xanthine dehydrogenase family protein subunit M [Bradyrhizobium sp. NP1]
MKPAPFDFFCAGTVDEAVALLARLGEDARPVAGGQSLVPAMNLRMATPTALVDISRIAELRGWRQVGDRIHIGAATTQAELMRDSDLAVRLPLLAAALPNIGHVQTRSRGTIGGSLVNADPSAEIGLVAATLEAILVLRSAQGERRLAAREFQLGALTTAIAPGELLVEIIMPTAPAGARCAFRELARRHGDFALVAVAVQRSAGELKVGIGGLEEAPRRCDRLTARLAEEGFAADAIDDAVRVELADVAPLSDIHASGDYRRHLAAVLLKDCLMDVLR